MTGDSSDATRSVDAEPAGGERPRTWRLPMVGRDPDERHRASTPLELLFDLTLVVAVALAAGELHHALTEGQVAHALGGYAIVFFAIWWAWMNFTWFASAYDTDDVPYRLLTLVQMGGVLVFAAGIPAAFERFDFTTVVIGYVIMRLAMVAQWLRAAAEHPDGRACTLRYAAGVALVQAAWIGRLWVPGPAGLIGLVVLVAAELAVPVWAEFSGRPTAWHPGHIAERYGLFTIICLGEVVLATTTAVQSALASRGLSAGLLATAVAGLLLVFALWWSYFKHSASDRIRLSLPSALVWGYGHYAIFAAVAALGAGLQVVVDFGEHVPGATARAAGFAVAVPVAVYLVVGGALHGRLGRERFLGLGYTVAAAVVVVALAAAAPALSLPVAVVLMALAVAVLLAANLVAAQRRAA